MFFFNPKANKYNSYIFLISYISIDCVNIMCYNFFVSPERITVSLRDMPLRQVPRIVGRKKVFMFDQPIHSTPLSTLEDIKKFSYEYGVLKAVSDDKEFIKTFCQNNGQIAICDETQFVWVTPYRSEISSILKQNGFTEKSFYVPFSNGGEIPDRYKWLKIIADAENWAETHCMAKAISNQKGLKEIRYDSATNFKITEIERLFTERDNPNHPECEKILYQPMVQMYLMNNTGANVGTYIIVDKKTLLICDEYGRTFLIKAKTVINHYVNLLLEAGYTHNSHAECYVTFVPKAEDLSPLANL